jgi:hypothetical protein
MKISKERIQHLASSVLDRLQKAGKLAIDGPKERVVANLHKAITDELSVEDRLNQEVRTLLKQFDAEFEQGKADYQKMFVMVKNKLIRERNLIL